MLQCYHIDVNLIFLPETSLKRLCFFSLSRCKGWGGAGGFDELILINALQPPSTMACLLIKDTLLISAYFQVLSSIPVSIHLQPSYLTGYVILYLIINNISWRKISNI